MDVLKRFNADGLEVFDFGDLEYDHVVGAEVCEPCWSGYPQQHECGMIGCLLHAQFGDENADCDYWLYEMGDLCRTF
jgi:hypothetical protein